MTKIVVADDDRMFRKAAETTLLRQGYAVTTASDREEALQLIRSERPDIIVLDLIMPKLQGFDVRQVLKQDSITAAIPVIVLSSLRRSKINRRLWTSGPSHTSIRPPARSASL